jgi:hypothetical protein
VPDAGKIIQGIDSVPVQIMHNGLKVIPGKYYDEFYVRIIEGLRGHHEPQEEKVFNEILKCLMPGATMLECGAYWSYYSMWFQKSIPNARSIMIEPELDHLATGEKHFALNNMTGTFMQGYIGEFSQAGTPPVYCVDDLLVNLSVEDLAVLHADIQGHEFNMLNGATQSLKKKLIDFIFISTHGEIVHLKCLRYLKCAGYYLVAEHTPEESYSYDGLIVATRRKGFARVPVSRRRETISGVAKSIVVRLASRLF